VGRCLAEPIAGNLRVSGAAGCGSVLHSRHVLPRRIEVHKSSAAFGSHGVPPQEAIKMKTRFLAGRATSGQIPILTTTDTNYAVLLKNRIPIQSGPHRATRVATLKRLSRRCQIPSRIPSTPSDSIKRTPAQAARVYRQKYRQIAPTGIQQGTEPN